MAKRTSTDDMPNLDNYTDAALVDDIGETKAEIKKLEKREGYLKEALKSRMDEQDTTEMFGDAYEANLGFQERSSLDVKRIREDMDEEWIEEYTRETTVSMLRLKELK